MKIYLVGGAVRDRLLGLEVTERDWVVVGATPEQMRRRGFKQVGKDFPVFLHPQTGEEYALARTERKTGPGYKGFAVEADPGVSLEQDLRRRDLTINAMAMDEQGRLIDPFGGEKDLREGLLRHVSPAFAEDPVRILRVARFAARFARWGFRVAHATHRLMGEMVASAEVDALVPERVWAETEKALGEERPAQFFKVLRGCGALGRIFPEIDALLGREDEHRHHSTLEEIPAFKALEAAAAEGAEIPVRFAALCAWLPAEAVQALCERLRLPKDYRDLAVLSAREKDICAAAAVPSPERLLQSLERGDAFRRRERFERFLRVCAVLAQTVHAQPRAAAALRAALAACARIDTKELAARGFKGKAFAEALRSQRLHVIAERVRRSG